MRFTHLRVHSEYSLLESACRVQTLVSRAKQLGFDSLALTDKNVMYGTIPFYKACQQAQIKPIIGLEAQVLTGAEGAGKSYPLILLAKDATGYRHLVNISNHLNMNRKKTAIDIHTLQTYSANLFALSGGAEGEIGQCLLHEEWGYAQSLTAQFAQIFEEGHFFLEVGEHGTREGQKLNNLTIELAKRTGLPIVATNTVRYVEQQDALTYQALRAINDGATLTESNHNEAYLKSTTEMETAFPPELHVALRNSANIADACHLSLPLGEQRLPKFPLPKQLSSDEALKQLCERGLKARYSTVTEETKQRLDYELSIISNMGFSDYFLIVWDFMKYAREQGIATGPGRGSAAGSLVAYVLYITDVDPIEHGLLFERFLNPERVSLPDIDIDFPDTRRDEMIHYIASKYGQDHVAQIVTFGTLAARAAVRDIGKVLDVKPKLINEMASKIPSRPGITLAKAVKESEELHKLIESSQTSKRLFELAQMVEGFPRHTSTHAAGIIISAEPLSNLIPVKSGHESLSLTQFPMEDLEELGLLKIDLLGLRNLTLIEVILKNIEKKVGQRLALEAIPFTDAKTFKLLSEGDTTGVFQLESPGMRRVLKELQPSEFEDIVAVNALYRPGPMENIPVYIGAKHGKRKIVYPHPDLEPLLKKTYGVIVYQEQIIQITSLMAGFSLGEADLLRRAISKKNRKLIEEEKAHFISGCLQNGYTEKTATMIYRLLVRFADYGFNRSHAVAYSVIAYQLAYLKANYPVEFYTALLSSVIGNQEKISHYLTEVKRREIEVLPPSVNKSNILFTIRDGHIQFGLLSIKNVGLQALKELIRNRSKDGEFSSLFDLCKRVSGKKVTRRALESLILAGACDDFGIDRASLLATLDDAIEFGEQEKARGAQVSFTNVEEKNINYVHVPPFSESEKLAFEQEVLGYYLSSHPLDRYNRLIRRTKVSPIIDLQVLPNKQSLQVVGIIESIRTIKTKRSELMAFVQISDQTSEITATIFPKVYGQVRELLVEKSPVLVTGVLEERDRRGKQVIVHTIQKLDDLYQQMRSEVYLKVEREKYTEARLTTLKQILLRFPGLCTVNLYYEADKQVRRLSDQYAINDTELCLHQLRQVLGEENVILVKP